MASLAPATPAAPQVPNRKLTTIDLIGGIFCHICALTYKNKKEFDSHYLQHTTGTEEITYTCVVCHLTCTSYPSFRGHCYTIHVSKRRFKCDNCSKFFSKLSALKDHIDVVHNNKCMKPGCNQTFPSKKDLHVHEILHKDDTPPYECQTCTQPIEDINICEDHIDQHCIFTYACPICAEYITKNNATQHLAKHFGDALSNDLEVDDEIPEDSSINTVGGILCCYCRKPFKNRIAIETHFVEDHPNESVVYTCLICNKHYEKYSLYGAHCYQHISKNRFTCDVCNKSFPRLSLMVTHSNEHNIFEQMEREEGKNGRVGNQCQLCALRLADGRAALRHLAVHRRTQFSCPVCQRRYAEKYLLMKHVPQHFEAVFHMCKVCGKMFSAKNRLIEHVKIHSSIKKYECKLCGKAFLKPYQLEQHLNIHTGARPYTCEACPKSFASLPNLQKHVRRMHDNAPKTRKPIQYNVNPKTENIEEPPEINHSFAPMEMETKFENFDEYKVQESKMISEIFDLCNEDLVQPETIDSMVVKREAERYEIEVKATSTSSETIAELTPLLPEDIDEFASEMLAYESPAIIPREYGPDFGPEEVSPSVAPQLVAPMPPRPWEPPVITKVYGNYYDYEHIDDLQLSFIDTDTF